MHHLVYVILPQDIESIERYVDNLLAGSDVDAGKAYPSYDAPCSCRGSLARARAFKTVDNSGYGKRWLEALRDARKCSDETAENRILETRFAEMQKIEEADPDYGKTDPECDICNGSGFYSCSRDPTTTFDWWVIGGRWSGIFRAIATQLSGYSKSFKGNIAKVSEVRRITIPAAIVTPEGYLYEGPMDLGILREKLQPWECEEYDQWKTQVEQLLTTYANCIVIAVDCHS